MRFRFNGPILLTLLCAAPLGADHWAPPRPVATWAALATNDMGERTLASPAVSAGRGKSEGFF